MGVVNVTPDSFSDGGLHLDPQRAIERGLELAREGADYIDVGGESTRPGAEAVDARVERERVEPVVRELARSTRVPISIDTAKASVAEAALEAGARIVNDVTAGLGDPDMLPLVGRAGCGYVLMHMQGTPRDMQQDPRYGDVVRDVVGFLRERVDACQRAGIDAGRLWIDPGIGFGKTLDHNLELIRRLGELKALGLPVLVGVSRKSFIGRVNARLGSPRALRGRPRGQGAVGRNGRRPERLRPGRGRLPAGARRGGDGRSRARRLRPARAARGGRKRVAMSYPILGWALQILILTTGIYIFLRFLRTTRGGGLIRGLVVALLFGAVGIWGLSKLLGLSELEHIVQSVTGFVVVIFAILFQPELRRGIAQLGEHPLLGRLLDQRRPETVSEVAQAVVNLAKKRRGALVAFEREMPLDSYIENGVEIDSAAKSILIESVFHPGGVLHDGAVVIRKDRVAAALCLFPLTENIEISKSTGTRHRAALGLTDTSDAVTVAVSEETGDISLCRHGSMRRKVPPHEVESALREALQSEEEAAQAEGSDDPITFVRELLTVDAPRKLAALALAVALFFVSHQEISSSREYSLRVSACGPETVARAAPGELLIQLPSEDDRLVYPRTGEILRVVLAGPSDSLDKLATELGGVVKVDPTWLEESNRLSTRQVTWGPGQGPKELRLRVDWIGEEPRLAYQTYVRREIELLAEHAPIDVSGLEAPYEAGLDGLAFAPPSVVLSRAAQADREAGRGRAEVLPGAGRDPRRPAGRLDRTPAHGPGPVGRRHAARGDRIGAGHRPDPHGPGAGRPDREADRAGLLQARRAGRAEPVPAPPRTADRAVPPRDERHPARHVRRCRQRPHA